MRGCGGATRTMISAPAEVAILPSDAASMAATRIFLIMVIS
jgi:hypothetical protein